MQNLEAAEESKKTDEQLAEELAEQVDGYYPLPKNLDLVSFSVSAPQRLHKQMTLAEYQTLMEAELEAKQLRKELKEKEMFVAEMLQQVEAANHRTQISEAENQKLKQQINEAEMERKYNSQPIAEPKLKSLEAEVESLQALVSVLQNRNQKMREQQSDAKEQVKELHGQVGMLAVMVKHLQIVFRNQESESDPDPLRKKDQ